MDAPRIFGRNAETSGLFSVSGFKQEHLLPPDTRTTLIGKSEAQIAFLNLLGDSKTIGALDVTDEVGFDWTRWSGLASSHQPPALSACAYCA